MEKIINNIDEIFTSIETNEKGYKDIKLDLWQKDDNNASFVIICGDNLYKMGGHKIIEVMKFDLLSEYPRDYLKDMQKIKRKIANRFVKSRVTSNLRLY